MKKNKLLSILLACSMVASLGLTGCSSSEPNESKPAEQPAEQPAAQTEQQSEAPKVDANGYREIPETNLTVTAGSSGGGWYIMGAGLNEGITSLVPNLKMTLIPGGGSSNPTVVNDGEAAQIGFTYITNAKAAEAGSGDYTEAHSNLAAICSLNIKQFLNVNLVSDLGIDNFADFVSKTPKVKISAGPRGSGSESMFKSVLASYGIDYDTIGSWGGEVQFVSTNDGMDGIRNNQIDGIVNSSVLGLPSLIEICSARDLSFLSIDEEHGKKLVEDYGFGYDVIPAGTYPGQDKDIPTISDTVILVVNKDVSDDVVYNITKIICENKEKWDTIHNSFLSFTPETAPETGIALHPGAEQYYKEAGLLK